MVNENDLEEILAQELERIKECGGTNQPRRNRKANRNQQGYTAEVAEEWICSPAIKERLAGREKQAE